jgi:hypothetical protein
LESDANRFDSENEPHESPSGLAKENYGNQFDSASAQQCKKRPHMKRLPSQFESDEYYKMTSVRFVICRCPEKFYL